MSSRHLVDPELLPLIEQLPKLELTKELLPQIRASRSQMFFPGEAPLIPGVEVFERHVPGPQGAPDVRVLVYRPQEEKPRDGWPAMLHIHGGGFILGTPDASDVGNRLLAKQVGCVIVSVDYRLAPETPFPGPIEDCYAALKWLHTNAAELGVDARRLSVGGESAGGGLAAALALLARDRGEVPLIFQMLVYPMLDDRTASSVEPFPHVGEFVWTRASNRFGWESMLGHAPGKKEGVSPYVAPARAENLKGLPPACIFVGALDLFLEEDMEYARRLLQSGVPTELHVYPGAFHGFMLASEARVSKAFARDHEAALRNALHPGSARP